ncbi:MAG: hypothetical protein RLZZ234_289, partial [Candidatus Parcubacteria bacterium]
MQRITKFSAIIGFLAVMTFIIGMFMYMPMITEKTLSLSPAAAFAWSDGSFGGDCCGLTSGGTDNSHTTTPPPPPPPPAKPLCTLNAAPMTIEKGSSATLTWNTTNATAVKLDGVAVAV